MWSIIRSRVKHRNTPEEYIDNDANKGIFALSTIETSTNHSQSKDDPLLTPTPPSNDDNDDTDVQHSGEPRDPDEALPPEDEDDGEIDADTAQAINDQANGIDLDAEYNFHEILSHTWDNGTLLLKVKYITDDQRWSILEVPFHVLKRDVPVELA
jgi:hypothetical protein